MRKGKLLSCEQFQMLPGRGVSAVVNGRTVLAGNPKMLADNDIALTSDAEADAYLQSGGTLIYVAVDGILAGYLVLSDTVRA